MHKNQQIQWHSEIPEVILDRFGVQVTQGLSDSQVEQAQSKYGRNELTPRQGQGPLIRFLLQFHQPLIYLLLAATVITAALQEWVDSAVIFLVVFVNAIIGFIQESKALEAIQALSRSLISEATVIRNGTRQRLNSTELVPGDIVLLQSGDKVPADLRLLSTRDLRIDESVLTGESIPVEKKSDMVPAEAVLADRTNMGYSSTLVTYGQGTGVVIATGDQTEVGRISELMASTQSIATPLTRKIADFSHLLLYVILIMAFLTFMIGTLRGESTVEMFMAAVALAVGAIPEGLPAALTITLAIGVSRMAKRRAVIRKLPAVETLGSTTVICSDKTGTLTENQMTVQEIIVAGKHYRVTGSGYTPEGDLLNGESAVIEKVDGNSLLGRCLLAGALCNDSDLMQKEGRWTIQGDPTEGALLVSARKAGFDLSELKSQYPRVDTIPFESEYQYMATLHDTPDKSKRIIWMKGSVEAILNSCNKALQSDGQEVMLDKERVHSEVEVMASKGLRVLAFAERQVGLETNSINHNDLKEDLRFIGLQGMIDPPREEAIQAVQKCQEAGVTVKMITGDHALTASVIAQEIGIISQKRPDWTELPVMTGKQLEAVSDSDLPEVAEKTAVFARVTPEQKLRLVQALQCNHHVVAMTGDGVNDAPALKQADIGIAMGINGTEVAKEAADMVLTDDNFASIQAAVEEGRGVFDNLTKFIIWTLPTNLGEGLVILTAILFALELPILPIQILWINMTTAVLLGLMLAFEPKEPGLMSRPPRKPDAPILTTQMIERIVTVAGIMLFAAMVLFKLNVENNIAAARTVAVNVFIIVEMFYLYNCRSLKRSMFDIGLFSNKWVLVGSACMLVLQLMFTYTPWMNTLFQSHPIGLSDWLEILAFGLLAYVVIETEKWYLRRKENMKMKKHSNS